MFVIAYDFDDMPANSQTFLRQRTVYMPMSRNSNLSNENLSQEDNLSCKQNALNSRQFVDCFSHEYEMVEDNLECRKKINTNQTSIILSSPSSCSSSLLSSSSNPVFNLSADGEDFDEIGRSNQSSSNSFWNISRKSLTEPNTPNACFSHTPYSGSSISSMSSLGINGSVMSTDQSKLPAYLRYLVHLRFHTTRSGKLYLHTDLRLIFSRDKFEFDPRVATYELRSFIDAPINPRYSPKKWTSRLRTTK